MVEKDKDLIVRSIFLKSLKHSTDSRRISHAVDTFKYDKLAGIRNLCIELSIEKKLEHTKELLETSLFDNSKSVRELSRWYLNNEFEINNFRSRYIEQLESKNLDLGVIYGLGEVGDKSDSKLILNLLGHKSVRVRKAAFLSIAKINPELVYNHVLENICNESPSVVKVMTVFISDSLNHYPLKDVWDLMLKAKSNHVKTNLLITLISKSSKWRKLTYMLQAAEILNEAQVKTIYSFLRKWIYNYNRSFNQPLPDEIKEIKRLINISSLDKDFLRSISTLLPSS